MIEAKVGACGQWLSRNRRAIGSRWIIIKIDSENRSCVLESLSPSNRFEAVKDYSLDVLTNSDNWQPTAPIALKISKDFVVIGRGGNHSIEEAQDIPVRANRATDIS